MDFPKNISIKLTDEESSLPIKGVIFIIKLYSKTENDFFIITNKTDEDGTLSITNDMIRERFEINGLPLDLQDFNAMMLIWNMNGSEINNIIKAINGNKLHQNVSACAMDDLETSKNFMYESRSGLYEFNNDINIQIFFTTKKSLTK